MRTLPPARVSRRALAPIKHARKCEVCKPSVASIFTHLGRLCLPSPNWLRVDLLRPHKAVNWVSTK